MTTRRTPREKTATTSGSHGGARRLSTIADWPLACDLPAELARLLRQIPRGCVTTYGALATALGDRAAARWVGERLLDHPHGPRCPCHRVVRINGDPGLYIGGDAAAKLERLRREGVPAAEGCVDVSRPFTEFKTTAPLRALREFQESVPALLRLSPLRRPRPVQFMAGLDVAYSAPGRAVGACVVLEVESGETVRTLTLEDDVRFPYVSGYLAFRELPLMLQLFGRALAEGPAADVVLIDGNGLLHPRRAGIAACFGLLADVPTIGIGKTLLCGSADVARVTPASPQPVLHNEELVGMALKSTQRSKAVYVSPGNHIDVAGAAEIAGSLFAGHRLPEPLHRADRLSKQAAREIKDCLQRPRRRPAGPQ